MESSIAVAFGAVIGYIGAEVAEETSFNRLLWPQRYYNYISPLCAAKLIFFMPMGGPLYRAALTVLDVIRNHGLYAGKQRGDMLGTAFFAENRAAAYDVHAVDGSGKSQTKKAIRNCLWVEVLKYVARSPRWKRPIKGQGVRAIKPVLVLDLEPHTGDVAESKNQVFVSEQRITLSNILGIFLSELSAVCIVIAVILWNIYGQDRNGVPPFGIIPLYLVPLVLKLLAAIVSLRRDGLVKPKEVLPPSEKKIIFEVDYPSFGVLLIRTSTHSMNTVQQFFRHYGHPIRDSRSDRRREVVSIFIAYAFVLQFPIGLFALLSMNKAAQYLWLSYQLYCVIAMHVQRICGWQGCGGTEELLAELLSQGKTVFLTDGNTCVKGNLDINVAESVTDAERIVRGILDENAAKI
ncbi:hypothetical protein TWF730_005326 [Orbilia blumenaviensis]|uniref:Uncharacterized protein n=1 Tax=Orbilia blumenaviensis TaxID=1796055 RepID=A0AAV9VLC4_9PEZI